jgi:hypothetical protein
MSPIQAPDDSGLGSTEPIERLLAFETLISDLSSRFINLPPSSVDAEVEDALRRVCALLCLDSAVLWQWSASEPDLIAPTHAYPEPAAPQPDTTPRQELFPWVVERMRAGRAVAVARLEELPPEAAVDLEAHAALASGRT